MRIWNQISQLAAQTPETRNRYVDFLRAISILVVIVGHWLISAVHYVDGELEFAHLFSIQPLSRWLTWIFQVMPVFFVVGGYANAASITSAQRKGIGYASWLSGRLTRLMTPLIFLLVIWASVAGAMYLSGASPDLIQLVTRASLVPTWFLAIYIMVVVLAPPMYRLWRRLGFVLIGILVAAAIFMDILFFGFEIRWTSWSNYFWVWLAIHSLGFAWHDGRLGNVVQHLVYSLVALGLLWVLVFQGPYPLAMVGFPDLAVSNTTPPKITLLALGLFQFSILMVFERPARRILTGRRLWTATLLINSMIMTIYLWHITLSVALVGLLYAAGGLGIDFEPGSFEWWLTRPAWIAVLGALLFPLALFLSPFERMSRVGGTTEKSLASQTVGAMMLCLGVALLARFGFGGHPIPGLDVAAFALVIVGAGISMLRL